MYENQLRKLATDKVAKPEVGLAARKSHAEFKGAGYANTSDLCAYLGVSQRSVPKVLAELGVKTNRAGRTSWASVWENLWKIRDVPTPYHELMKRALLDPDQVAERVGVSPRSILRDGDRARSRYELPRHIQLSERRRRYHPEMILLWEMELPLEDWMKPIERRRHLGLERRIDHTKPP